MGKLEGKVLGPLFVRACSHFTDSPPHFQYIMEEQQRHPNAESFWQSFSTEGGQRLTYQQILDRLADRRAASASQDAANARAFCSNDLDHPNTYGAFRYAKGGKSYLLTKDDAIAKTWRELLAKRSDIAAQWEALCAVCAAPATTQGMVITATANH